MIQEGFNGLTWGIFFIMIDFRIQGFDIFPDVVGYILFAMAIKNLISRSSYFKTAENLNVVMIVLSVFSIWERPAQPGVNISVFGPFSILFGFAMLVLDLILMYYIFSGIKDIALQGGRIHFVEEADRRYRQYVAFKLASLAAFIFIFIPFIAFFYVIGMFIIGIILTVVLMRFMSSCRECLE